LESDSGSDGGYHRSSFARFLAVIENVMARITVLDNSVIISSDPIGSAVRFCGRFDKEFGVDIIIARHWLSVVGATTERSDGGTTGAN